MTLHTRLGCRACRSRPARGAGSRSSPSRSSWRASTSSSSTSRSRESERTSRRERRRAVVVPQRLRDRVRRAARARSASGSTRRPPARVPRRARGLRPWARRCRARAVGRAARRGARRPGGGRRRCSPRRRWACCSRAPSARAPRRDRRLGGARRVVRRLGPPLGGLLVELQLATGSSSSTCRSGSSASRPSAGASQRSATRPAALPDWHRRRVLAVACVGLLALGLAQAPDWGWDWRSLGCLGGRRSCGRARCWWRAPGATSSRSWRSTCCARRRSRWRASRRSSSSPASPGCCSATCSSSPASGATRSLQAGLAFAPGPMLAATSAALSRRLADRIGSPALLGVPGGVLFALGASFTCVCRPTRTTSATSSPGSVMTGLGVGLSLPALTGSALLAVPGPALATGVATTTAFRQIGGALGVAIFVAVHGTPGPAECSTRSTAASWSSALRDRRGGRAGDPDAPAARDALRGAPAGARPASSRRARQLTARAVRRDARLGGVRTPMSATMPPSATRQAAISRPVRKADVRRRARRRPQPRALGRRQRRRVDGAERPLTRLRDDRRGLPVHPDALQVRVQRGRELRGDHGADRRRREQPRHARDRVVDARSDPGVALVGVRQHAAVSGATVIDRPSEKTSGAGQHSVRKSTSGAMRISSSRPAAATSGPKPMKQRGP